MASRSQSGGGGRYKSSMVSFVVRLLGVVCYLLVTLPLIWAALPLRLLHPLMRKLGIPMQFLPMDLVQKYWARGLVVVAGIRVLREGLGKIKQYRGRAMVYMFSHASNLDGFIIAAYCPGAPKFIFKKELLFTNPPIAWFGYAAGHIPIERSNRAKAISSLEDAKNRIHKYNRSVAVSPEGTRSLTGEIQEFKKGPFHLAEEVGKLGVPIVPVILHGAFDLWPPKQVFASAGQVTLHVAEPITMTPSMSRDDLSAKVHLAMVQSLAEMKAAASKRPAQRDDFSAALAFITATVATAAAIKWRFF